MFRFPAGSFEIVNDTPSGCAMAVGSTHALIEISTRNISWGQRRLVHSADNLTTFMFRLS